MNGFPVSTIAIPVALLQLRDDACADSKAPRPKTVGFV
jgi:hypothetical protein